MPTGSNERSPGVGQQAVVGTGVNWVALAMFEGGSHHSASEGMLALACYGLCFILREDRSLGFYMKCPKF